MSPLLYLLYYLLVKAVGKVGPVFGTRLSRRVHRRAADEVARDVEFAAIETVRRAIPRRRSVRPSVSGSDERARRDHGV